MRILALSQGKFTKVDDEDFEFLSQWKWCLSSKGYAQRGIYVSGKHKVIWLHREILNAPKNKSVDHINGNPLDNRKDNLRIATHKENLRNLKLQRINNKSGFKGVLFFKAGKRVKRWKAEITVNYKTKCLGYFLTKQEAGLAYNEAANKYFGRFAKLNII